MRSMSRLGIGLSVVFGCFLLALVAELYYVFFWRRRLSSGSVLNGEVEDEYSSPSRELFYLLCCKKQRTTTTTRGLHHHRHHRQREVNGVISGSEAHHHQRDDALLVQESPDQSTEFVAKFFPVEGMDSEILRIHNLLGPPRILFTIKEETKEDLDSEDGRSRKSRRGSRSRSLSDMLSQMSAAAAASGTVTPIDNTPFVTPPSSPPFCTPMETPLTPLTFMHTALFPRLSAVNNKQSHPLTEDSRSCSSSSSSSASSSLPCSFPSSFTSSASHSPFISPPPCTTLHIVPNQDKCTLHPPKEGHLNLPARQQQCPIKGDLYPNANGLASPPPKFKFLRDAEMKAANNTALDLNKQQQQQHRPEPAPPSSPSTSSAISSDEDGSFITIIVGDSNSSSSSLVHHPSPVSGLHPTGHIMPLSPLSPCLSPLFSPLTGSLYMKTPTDSAEK